MKVVTYNIQFGVGRDTRTNLERIAATVSGADVIAFQEVTRAWPAGNEDQPLRLAELLSGLYWVYAPSVDIPHPAAPHTPGGRGTRTQFGNMLLSKTPILSSRVHALPRGDTTDIPRVALEGVVETTSSGPIRVYSVHLAYKDQSERAAQVQTLSNLHRDNWGSASLITPRPGGASIAIPPTPVNAMILGDFNMERNEPAYTAIISPEGERPLADMWVAAGNDPTSGITMPANPDTETWKDESLDYGFISAGLASRVRSARIDDTADGSDHQPVWFEVEL